MSLTWLRLLAVLTLALGVLISSHAQNVTLNVSSTPVTGITITASPPDNSGLTGGVTNFSLTYSDMFSIPTVVLTAPASFNGELFANWTINGIAQPPGQTVVTVVMAANENAVAVYNTPNVTVTVNSVNPASGVPITAAPADNAGLTGGTTSFQLNYPNLTTVTLTAPPVAGGNVFDHWMLGRVTEPQGQLQLRFALAGSVAASAVYVQGVPVNVQSQNPNSGVVITATPPDAAGRSGGTTAFTLTYAINTSVTLTAPATAGPNTFANWTINGVAQPAGQTQIQFIATTVITGGAFTVVAVYQAPANFTVTSSVAGANGAVSPSGVVTLAPGASQTFTATPSAGYMVNQWVLDGALVQTGGATYQVTRITANHTLQVSFSVIIIFHPADTNKDGRMVIAEVTAYASAWKRGLAWPNAPSPIPQAFVTNAIMLWKSGEAYTNQPGVAAPGTWIPLSAEPLVVKPALATQINAGSSVANVISQADGWFLVNVTVTAPQGTQAFTLEEDLPRGAQVGAVSAGGVFDARGFVLRWGPFMDAGTRIFSYRIRIGGSGTLSGSASFNGSIVKTTGDRALGGKS
jgi:hypothetical protein